MIVPRDAIVTCTALSDTTVVSFAVVLETSFGDRVFVVGDAEELGSWRPDAGCELKTDPSVYPLWSGMLNLPAYSRPAGEFEYKFVVIKEGNSALWEPGPNRRLPSCCCFGKPLAEESISGEDSDASTCVVDCEEDNLSSLLVEMRPKNCSANDSESGTDGSAEDEAAVSPIGQLYLWSGAHRVQKRRGPCEDAYFFMAHALGVADGVGSMADWIEYGVNSAAYATELMERVALALRPGGDIIASNERGPPELCSRAAISMAASDAQTFGASTITVCVVQGSTVGVSNLGDSGFMLLRSTPWGMEIAASSREQTHSWNCPYQLTHVPPELLGAQSKDLRLDSAADCEQYKLHAQPGDLLLLFSDGLVDNLTRLEMLEIVNEASAPCHDITRPESPPETIARALVLAAEERSHDLRAATPFAANARRHGKDWVGGKEDDITVVAAWVMRDECENPVEGCMTLSCSESPKHARRIIFESDTILA